jgi:hypothetical protein
MPRQLRSVGRDRAALRAVIELEMANVCTVSRRTRGWVSINGRQAGFLSRGEPRHFDVQPGNHRIDLSFHSEPDRETGELRHITKNDVSMFVRLCGEDRETG